MSFRRYLARNLRDRRGSRTQESFARKLNIDQASVHRIEIAEQNVTIDMLQKICIALKCNAADLLDR
ncbi:MAG: helix-turn-helix domain-containing protein [Parvularculaceae bacterium]